MLNESQSFADPHLESLLPEVKSSRRGFLAAGGGVGFALAAGPLNAQSVITTPADGLEAGDTKVAVAGGDMPAYMAAPAAPGKYPVVVVIPEIFGMHEYQKDMCRRLAKAGYMGVTLDPFFRMGDLSKMTVIGEVVAAANKLEDKQMLSDLDSLLDHAAKSAKADMGKVGVTGHCRGGRSVWMYAVHSKRIKTGVSWYGGLNPMPPAMPQSPIDVVANLNAPVLGLYAGADTGIPQAAVDRLVEALKGGNAHAKASKMIVYPNVPHAFHADYRPSYRKPEAEAAWQEMLAWFKQHGVA